MEEPGLGCVSASRVDCMHAALSHGVLPLPALLEGKVRKQSLENFTFHKVNLLCNKQITQEGIVRLWPSIFF